MMICDTSFCGDCIDRAICQTLRILREVSDRTNHNQESERLNELLRERERLAEEIEKMGGKV